LQQIIANGRLDETEKYFVIFFYIHIFFFEFFIPKKKLSKIDSIVVSQQICNDQKTGIFANFTNTTNLKSAERKLYSCKKFFHRQRENLETSSAAEIEKTIVNNANVGSSLDNQNNTYAIAHVSSNEKRCEFPCSNFGNTYIGKIGIFSVFFRQEECPKYSRQFFLLSSA
jgi:hypothetical protein